jgi:hypothetical protein
MTEGWQTVNPKVLGQATVFLDLFQVDGHRTDGCQNKPDKSGSMNPQVHLRGCVNGRCVFAVDRETGSAKNTPLLIHCLADGQ